MFSSHHHPECVCVCDPDGWSQGRGRRPLPPAAWSPNPDSRAGAGQVCSFMKRDPRRAALPAGSHQARAEAGDEAERGAAPPAPHPRGLQGRLGWGTISRPGYQCPSGSTSHKNRKNWDKILHLPLIVSAQLFPRGDAIRRLHGCSCVLAWSAPRPQPRLPA